MTASKLIEILSRLPADLVVATEDGQDPSEVHPIASAEIRQSDGSAYEPVLRGEKYIYLAAGRHWRQP
jgi:hypothetical protein